MYRKSQGVANTKGTLPIRRLTVRAGMPRLLAAIVEPLAGNPFLRSVGLLASGAALAQVVTILALPVLTRIYLPSDFSALALFSALSIIASLGSCLGFDLAIPMARSRRDAVGVAGCAFISLLGVTLVVSALVIIALLGFGDAQAIARWPVTTFALLPLSTFIIGGYNLVEYWTMRQGRFADISGARIFQALCGSALQIGLGFAGWGALGLFIGYIAVSSLGMIRLAWRICAQDSRYAAFLRVSVLNDARRRYASFPKYTGPEAVANAASVYVPMILISAGSSGAVLGFVMLAQRLLQAPLMLIGRSVAQVYTSGAADAYRRGGLSDETAGVLRLLIGVIAGPALFLPFVAPDLAYVFLGREWREVGVYMVWLMPWAILHFLASSVLTTMHVRGLNAHIMALTIAGLAFRTILVGTALFLTSVGLVFVYAASGAIFYGLLLLVILRVNRIRFGAIVPRNRLARLGAAGAMVAGVLTHLVLALIERSG